MVVVNKVIQSAKDPSKVQCKSETTLKKLAKAAKKWLPAGKVLFLNTSDVNGQFFSDPQSKMVELGNYWAQTFAFRKIKTLKAQAYLQEFGQDFDFGNICNTTSASISKYLSHTHNSKTGPWHSLLCLSTGWIDCLLYPVCDFPISSKWPSCCIWF